MAGKTNPFHEIAVSVGKEIHALRKQAEKADVVPFGLEQVTKGQLRERFEKGNPATRRAIMAQLGGRKGVFELFGKQREG